MDTLDLRGKPCPIPVIEVKKRLARAKRGDSVAALVDNDIARQNLQKLAADLHYPFRHEPTVGGEVLVVITVGEVTPGEAASRDKAPPGATTSASGPVVAIGADVMGTGDEALGRMLLKSFIYSLTELKPPPTQILLFNRGIFLACAGSNVVEDLQKLAASGVEVSSCGACLNYYDKNEALQVGGVTNMAVIVEKLAGARRVINI